MQNTAGFKEFLQATLEFNLSFYTFRKLYIILEKKSFETEESILILDKGIKQGFDIIISIGLTLPRRLHGFIQNLTSQTYPETWETLSENGLRSVRNRCAFAAAVHRHAAIYSDEVAELPRFCAAEISWSNASVPLLSERMSENPLSKYIRGENGSKLIEIACCSLLVPAVELLALWNLAAATAGDPRIIFFLIKIVKNSVQGLTDHRDTWTSWGEDTDYSLYMLYTYGCYLSAVGNQQAAMDYFLDVISMKDYITGDFYVVPYAMLEQAMCHHAVGDTKLALDVLKQTREQYYSLSAEVRALYNLYSKIIINIDDDSTN